MFIAIYRWRLKPGMEAQFAAGWERRTKELIRNAGALGSRLHVADDGTYYAYAQWPDRETREAAVGLPIEDDEAREMMRDSVEVAYDETLLDVVSDHLTGC